jgi:hypothetical protein
LSEQLKPEHLAQFPGPRIERYNEECRKLGQALSERSGMMRITVLLFDWPADKYDNLEHILGVFRVVATLDVNGQRLNISHNISRYEVEQRGQEAVVAFLVHTFARALTDAILDRPKR